MVSDKMSSQRLNGKVAIITGSSGGIGKAIALELAKNGTYIVLNGRNKARLAASENEVRKIHSNIISVCCDVSTAEGGQLLINETISKFNRIDILVNNVGVSMRGYLADLKPEVFRIVFDTNILGVVCPTIPAISHLRLTKGSIVFISSVAGIRGLPTTSAYCSSKMALRSLAESIRIEEAVHDLHVGLIYVGNTEIDDGKTTIAPDGTKMLLRSRKGKGVQSKESVARAVVKNISKRKFITVLTTLGKLNAFLQTLFPLLVERIIIRNLKKFEEGFK
jgi:NAD(P)-dependent dehydrogenase (short-subunit alcohol dehydrogenase family)